jgi:hypothetical protein
MAICSWGPFRRNSKHEHIELDRTARFLAVNIYTSKRTYCTFGRDEILPSWRYIEKKMYLQLGQYVPY